MFELFKYILSGFWVFIGSLVLISMVFVLPLQCFYNYIRGAQKAKTIRIMGYPPPHCDVDGDFKPDNDED